jgi:quercetin dioxygenase-like cupin family protein
MSALARTIDNPVIKDRVTFVKTAAETRGECTLLQIELAPRGGNTIHYHPRYTERFEVIHGQLGITIDGVEQILSANQSVLVPINTLHRYYNPTDEVTTFLVELRPGNPGFEQLLRITYGLANDGKLTPKGRLDINLLQSALLLRLGGVHSTRKSWWSRPGIFSIVVIVARLLGQDRSFRKYLK